jgi:alpha-beta hydrolase superfamily lysophospholipase
MIRAMLRATLRLLRRLLLSTLLGLLVIGIGAWAHYVFTGPPLQPWHRASLDEEFTVARAGEVRTLADYRRLEDRLFGQLQREVVAKVVPGPGAPFNRFVKGSRSDPGVWPVNWNRTWEITPSAPRGGVLLLHGLTDSPYSLRSIGADLAARGFHVVGLRLPGHGTAPAGLVRFEVEDMEAATRLAMNDLRRRLGPEKPIYIIGYSNGAALAVSYSLAIQEGEPLPKPAGLVLVSPAIAVSRLAAIGRIRTGLSELPSFGRAAWSEIQPEVDPFKYQSFSLHAAGETQRLTSGIASRIDALVARGGMAGFPPVLVFLSTVDSTVRAEAVVEVLLGRLPPQGHELVLFDVNRYSVVQSLLVDDPGPLTRQLLARPQRPFALTVITNVNPRTQQVMELRAEAQSGRQTARLLDMEWPPGVFSLSHLALPFPPDDPLYGFATRDDAPHVHLGRIEARGENGVLRVPGWMLTRQRSNPFHAYVLARIDEFVVPAGGATR